MEVMSHRRVAQSYISAFNHYTFCFFRLSCSATYVNFTQFILKNNLFRVVFLLFTQFNLKWFTGFNKSHIEKLKVQTLIAEYNMINNETLD